jgi:hypothetical protein
MPALSDEALARPAIAATRIAPHARARWLRDLAHRLDPPPRPLAATREAAMAAFAKSWRRE